jgi:peroxiredoxin Q/BCP
MLLDLSELKRQIMSITTLKAGDKAPSFKTTNQDGKEISLEGLKGKKVVLYFYPKDSTPGCTMQACNLRDNYEALQKANYVVLGVSADTEKLHKRFIEKQSIPFDLLMDEDKTIINAYGVWGLKKFMGREFDGIHRTTFLIDEEGTIEEVIIKVKTKDHTNQILK